MEKTVDEIIISIIGDLCGLSRGIKALEGLLPVLKRSLGKDVFDTLEQDIIIDQIMMYYCMMNGSVKLLTKTMKNNEHAKEPFANSAIDRLTYWLEHKEKVGPNPPTDWRQAVKQPYIGIPDCNKCKKFKSCTCSFKGKISECTGYTIE